MIRFLVLIIMTFGFSQAVQASSCRGGGGDGPVPMFDPNPYLPTIWSEFNVKGPVKEFIYWENKEQLVYRNTVDEVRKMDLTWNSDTRFFGYPWELVRTVDPQERFLVTRKEASVVDTASSPLSIAQLRTPEPFSDAVFWYHDFLFGLMGTRQRLSFFGYRAGTQEAFSCNVPISEPGVRLASGAKFPNAFLFRQESTGMGVKLFIYRVKLSTNWMAGNCELISKIEFPEILPGRVKGLHLVRGGESFIVEIENAKRPILFASAKGCVYHDFELTTPMVANAGFPVVIGRDSQGKLQLFNLQTEKKRQLLTLDLLESPSAEKLWMTRSGADLLAVLKDATTGRDKVVRFELH